MWLAEVAVVDKLLASYALLTAAEQRTLQVLAVLVEPVSLTSLKRILLELSDLDPRFKGLAAGLQQSLRNKLEARGLLLVKAGKLLCPAVIAQNLVLEAVTTGVFALIRDEGLLEIPLVQSPLRNANRYFADNYPAFSPLQEQRRLLYALHSDDVQRVFELLGIKDPFATPKPAMSRALLAICANPMPEAWVAALHPGIQYQILRPLLQASVVRWSADAGLYGFLNRLLANQPDSHPLFKVLQAEQRLYRGDWQTLELDLQALATRDTTSNTTFDTTSNTTFDTTSHALALLASLLFLQGNTAASLTTFQQVLAATRKQTRKRSVAVAGIPGLIYLLALAKDNRESQLQANALLAEQQAKASSKQAYADAQYDAMWVLEKAREIKTGKRQFAPELLSMNLSIDAPLVNLLIGLVFYWHNQDPDESVLVHVKNGLRAARQAGYRWFEFESQQLLDLLEPGSVAVAVAGDWGPPLTRVMPQQAGWERALQALAGVSSAAAAAGAAPLTAQRLIWFVGDEFGGLSLKPLEQKLKKDGTWSSGRAIALKRLVEDVDALTYLSEADLKICRHIRRDRSYSHYNYGGSVYTLESLDALLAARGHPQLFRFDDPERHLDIVEGQPTLLVQARGENFHLALEPFPHEQKRLILDEPGRLLIYLFTPELLHIAQILGRHGLDVPLSAKARVLDSVAAIAPLLTVHSDIAGVGNSQATLVEADGRLYVRLQPLGDGLRLAFYVQPFCRGPVLVPGEGGASLFAEVDGQSLHTRRDLDAERRLLATVLGACHNLVVFSPGEYAWEDTEAALEGLLLLQGFGEQLVLNWLEGKRLTLSKPQGLSQMTVAVRKKSNWFELSGELQADGNKVYSMQALLALLNTSTSRFIPLGEGEFLTLTTELRKRLAAFNGLGKDGKVHGLSVQSLDEAMEGMRVTTDKAWQALQQRLQQAQDLDPQVPSTLQADLRDYQVAGFKWLYRLAEWGAGACLADDMGLGKTLQSLALVVSRAALGPCLVLAPTSVCTNWMEEARHFAPTLNPIRFGDDARQQTLAELKPYDVLVCSYGLLQSERKALQAVHWNIIIADEAQAFKNVATQRSRAVMGLSAEFKMLATGTPIENHLGELWNLFQFINPGLLGSLENFNEKYAQPIQHLQDANASDALRRMISPFILRRLKRDVLTELPPRTEITVRVDLNKDEQALYEAVRREAVEQLGKKDLLPNEQRIRVLASITKLRRVVCNPNMVFKGGDLAAAKMDSSKLQAFGEILDELLENRHKALVFSQFVEHLGLIRAYLDGRGISYQYLDGATSVKKRAAAVAAFQAGEGDLFLISLKAGGAGLNLTAADYVIHMDPWWNPAVEDQASDRAHRIGQRRPVTVYRLVSNNTIEAKIVDLHGRKRDLADSLLEGSEMSARMNLDDMLALINP